MPLTPLRRSSSVSSLTDLVESGRWLLISSSFLPSLLVLASFKPSNSSSPFEVSSVSVWEVSGAWPPPLPSKMSPSRSVVLLAVLYIMDMLLDTSSLPSSTYILSHTRPGVHCSGPLPVSRLLLRYCDLSFPKVNFSSALDERAKRNSIEINLPNRRRASSSTRSGRCSRIVGCGASTL